MVSRNLFNSFYCDPYSMASAEVQGLGFRDAFKSLVWLPLFFSGSLNPNLKDQITLRSRGHEYYESLSGIWTADPFRVHFVC